MCVSEGFPASWTALLGFERGRPDVEAGGVGAAVPAPGRHAALVRWLEHRSATESAPAGDGWRSCGGAWAYPAQRSSVMRHLARKESGGAFHAPPTANITLFTGTARWRKRPAARLFGHPGHGQGSVRFAGPERGAGADTDRLEGGRGGAGTASPRDYERPLSEYYRVVWGLLAGRPAGRPSWALWSAAAGAAHLTEARSFRSRVRIRGTNHAAAADTSRQ